MAAKPCLICHRAFKQGDQLVEVQTVLIVQPDRNIVTTPGRPESEREYIHLEHIKEGYRAHALTQPIG